MKKDSDTQLPEHKGKHQRCQDLDAVPDTQAKDEKEDLDKKDEDKPEKEEEYTDLLKAIQESLGEKVMDVRISKRLKSSPVCLVTTNAGTTFNMEQLLRGTGQVAPSAKKILEVNPGHPLFEALQKTYQIGSKSSEFNNCCDLVYYQAIIVEGYEIEDPVEFSGRIANLLVDAYASE